MLTIENFIDFTFSFSPTIPPRNTPTTFRVYFPTEERGSYSWTVIAPAIVEKLILHRMKQGNEYLLEFIGNTILLPISEVRDKAVFQTRIQNLIIDSLVSNAAWNS